MSDARRVKKNPRIGAGFYVKCDVKSAVIIAHWHTAQRRCV
ncbi:hypothetical protein DAQ1742_03834 [Dickeya aquatica]|uniref:Uncharacterized protein n=1 Tax=Dickeya aquatica TaxID=1401087 RepID=A0A375AEU3_9GAMM|nr:hypothetical protein DAQ1742_03834 [Dickeya aquatica]